MESSTMLKSKPFGVRRLDAAFPSARRAARHRPNFAMTENPCLIKTIKLYLTNKLVHSRFPPVSIAATSQSASSVGLLRNHAQAAVLLYHPLRLKILAALLEPDSASGVARRMNLPRQTINYHVRELARAHLLSRAGRRRRRRLYEQCYVATARGYALSPELLGKLAADPSQVTDAFSAAYLISLASKVQSELGRVSELAKKSGKRLATLSINTELRFLSPEQRARFTQELQRAIVDVVGRHTAPYCNADGTKAEGRPFRLVLGCYPIPTSTPESAQ